MNAWVLLRIYSLFNHSEYILMLKLLEIKKYRLNKKAEQHARLFLFSWFEIRPNYLTTAVRVPAAEYHLLSAPLPTAHAHPLYRPYQYKRQLSPT